MNPVIYQAVVLKAGLRLYAKSGIKPNRDWTPKAMLQTATTFTGQKYKLGEYYRAANDLQDWINDQFDNGARL